ncbi:MAG: glycosyltransferase family 9 protein [Candidatus Zixiibacteriota bacterium]
MDIVKEIELRVRRAAFAMLRPLLKKGRNIGAVDPARISKVLFIRKDRIGDAVCSLPVLEALKSHLSHLSLGMFCSPRNHEVFRDDPRLDDVFLYRKRFWRDFSEIWRIRRMKYDVVIDLICDDSVTSLFLSQLCSAHGVRIGAGKARFRQFYDLAYEFAPDADEHIIDVHLKMLAAFGLEPRSLNPHVPIHESKSAREKVDRFFAGLPPLSENGFRIGYNLSVGKPERVWALENSRQLVARIVERHPSSQLVFICTSADRHRAESIMNDVSGSLFLLPDRMNMMEVSSLVSRLDLLITPDTSLVHVARSWNVPVVGTYPKWDARRLGQWRPYGQFFGVVMSEKDDNVFAITVDQVFDAYVETLNILKTAAE